MKIRPVSVTVTPVGIASLKAKTRSGSDIFARCGVGNGHCAERNRDSQAGRLEESFHMRVLECVSRLEAFENDFAFGFAAFDHRVCAFEVI
jgi:hypothetical protein